MQTFYSRVDLWLPIVLLIGVAAMVYAVVRGAAGPISIGLMSLTSGLILWTLLATQYVVDGADLKVYCGPFRWTIPISEITALKPTDNTIASPALSLDRLRIEYANGKSLIISPKDPEGLRAALEANGAQLSDS